MNQLLDAIPYGPPGRPVECLSVAIITEDEPFGLADLLGKFLKDQPDWLSISAAVVLDYAPSIGAASWWRSPWTSIAAYGPAVVARLLARYARYRFLRQARVADSFDQQNVPVLLASDPNARCVVDHLKTAQPDLIVSIGVNQVFKEALYDLAPLGALNVHLGLLPQNRGPAPVFWALHDGDTQVGVSVHRVVPRIDAGAVVAQMSIPVGERCLETVFGALRQLSLPVLFQALEQIRLGVVPYGDISRTAFPYRGAPTRTDIQHFREQGNRFFA